jgi:hypothetical protein
VTSDHYHKNVDILISKLAVVICRLLVTDQAATLKNGKTVSFEKIDNETSGGVSLF